MLNKPEGLSFFEQFDPKKKEPELKELIEESFFLEFPAPLRIARLVSKILSESGLICIVTNPEKYNNLSVEECNHLEAQGARYLVVCYGEMENDPNSFIQISSLNTREAVFDLPVNKFTLEQLNSLKQLYIAVREELNLAFHNFINELRNKMTNGLSSTQNFDQASGGVPAEGDESLDVFIDEIDFSSLLPIPPKSSQ